MSRNAFAQCEREYNENEAMREHDQYEREQMKADKEKRLARADACVKACDGIANPDDYDFARLLKLADEQRMACLQYEQTIKKLNEALEYQQSLCSFHGASGITDLIVQRDELIKVVEDAMSLLYPYEGGKSLAPKWEARASAAIAKVRP